MWLLLAVYHLPKEKVTLDLIMLYTTEERGLHGVQRHSSIYKPFYDNHFSFYQLQPVNASNAPEFRVARRFNREGVEIPFPYIV